MKTINKLLSSFGLRLSRIADEPRFIVRAFAAEMEARLRENDDRCGWEYRTMTGLETELYSQSLKLSCVMYDGTPPEIVRENAADNACYLMMVADNFGELYPSGNLDQGRDKGDLKWRTK
jgi:hypothetical protein